MQQRLKQANKAAKPRPKLPSRDKLTSVDLLVSKMEANPSYLLCIFDCADVPNVSAKLYHFKPVAR
jgi:hypothetical protein